MTRTMPSEPSQTATRSLKSVYMVLGSTIFAAAAQILMKFGMAHMMPAFDLHNTASWAPFVTALLGNVALVLGYVVQSGNALLLILALRDGQLSLLFPIISLTYVWVDLLSMYFFHDQMNIWKGAGIALIVGGVALLGRASAKS